ncbi:tRNA (guanosine(46)-N7)-methyltransferase TrmB [Prolixibacter sp. SD074]|uniref:tRNA (guanosine(46)-N7)-methyltransferase TrmB n=1 Tax=Prolixibacter sp. SD074 TaxID=2652391 RepID=UPI0012827BAF|nr:tRNA (guanosine(46)-N7)-methyltransferase TrmB [Prolixibacter sp. SD074]GET30297.1 tRNA (guanine-N(7)-)-methyltransferase [Prolixibacter sp. SD074]
MGKNKLSKFAEMETFGHVVQVPFRVLNEEGFDMKGQWNERFFKNENPIVLELGCGKGEYTVGLARRFPQFNFIGIDIKGSRMWKGAKESWEGQMKNVGFLRTNIELLNAFFAPEEIAEIWITFPDPQMKKVRKRLTSTRFMQSYRSFLKPGGIVHLKTDSNFMYQYTRSMIEENHLPVDVDTDDLYQSGLGNEILEIRTFYEQQWLDRGKTIKYLRFHLKEGELKEPDVEPEPDDYRSFGRNK